MVETVKPTVAMSLNHRKQPNLFFATLYLSDLVLLIIYPIPTGREKMNSLSGGARMPIKTGLESRFLYRSCNVLDFLYSTMSD